MNELDEIYIRVEKGIAWLTEHDPTGSFHFWFESGLTSLSPMPAQADTRREDWAAYYSARVIFERLWKKMTALEKKAAA